MPIDTPRKTSTGGPFRSPGDGGWLSSIRRISAILPWLHARKSAAQVGAHLATVVLITGALTFATVGIVSLIRLRADAAEQATVLAELSRQQVGRRLDGEARLAEARLGVLFNEAHRQARYVSEQKDVVKAIVSANHVAIQQLLAPASVTGELDALLVADSSGVIIGASSAGDLLAAGEAVARMGLRDRISSVLTDNSRLTRKAYRETLRVAPSIGASIGIANGRSILHAAIEPVFDDFGDIAGAVLGFRALATSEKTFERFSGIVNAGVVVADGDKVISASGPPARNFHVATDLADDQLISDAGDKRVGRCVVHDLGLRICAHIEASEVQETQQQMLRISERQAGTLFTWFLVLAAGSVGVLVTVVLISVRRVTRGLPQLATAAAAVADGDLDVPFRAAGIGEVRGLGQAFEVMLANLRESVGQTRRLAFFDPVTGLANREKMRIDGAAVLASNRRDVAFLFIDLDRFKSINDTFGHKSGDALLAALGARLSRFFEMRLKKREIAGFRLGRLGGDEFLVILTSTLSPADLQRLSETLIVDLGENFEIGTAHMTVGASIGIALGGRDGGDYDALLLSADVAMYEAKRAGRNSCAFFTEAAANLMQERLLIEQDLRMALKEGTLSVLYQPMISLTNGRVVGAEALVRWQHPQRGDIPPGKFIGIAEEAGLIAALGEFVLKRAISETVDLVRESGDLMIAVNVSVLQLEDPTFSAMVEASLAEVGFPLDRLEIEITESVAMQASDVVKRQLASLSRMGVRFSLDDFGTGYSNLSMLAQLQVDTLKIDRSLVDGVHANTQQQAIVQTILSLARSLGFDTVVEGVELEQDLDFVVAAGADIAQGFFFSRAISMDMLKALQNARSARRSTFRREPIAPPALLTRSPGSGVHRAG